MKILMGPVVTHRKTTVVSMAIERTTDMNMSDTMRHKVALASSLDLDLTTTSMEAVLRSIKDTRSNMELKDMEGVTKVATTEADMAVTAKVMVGTTRGGSYGRPS